MAKQTLGTKDEKRAKVLAVPVIMKFDRILAQAEALLVEHPMRAELTEAEIKQIADYFYAHELGADEAMREGGVGSDPLFASIYQQLTAAGIEVKTPFADAAETGSLAVGYVGGIILYGRRSSYPINTRVSIGGQVLSSGAPELSNT